MRAPRITGGIAADAPFWDGLADGVFRLARCADCRRWLWPAHFRCEHCGSWEIRWEALEPVGRVYTFSRVFQTPGEVRARAGDVPYAVVLVEIPAAGNVRVSGALDGPDEALAIGAAVRGVFLPPKPEAMGHPTLAWALEPGR